MLPENFKVISEGIEDLSSKNCHLPKNDKFPTELAAILDIGKWRKTIAHNGKVLAMFPENFKAIGQGVQELSSGNCSNTQQFANFPTKWHLAAILDFGK